MSVSSWIGTAWACTWAMSPPVNRSATRGTCSVCFMARAIFFDNIATRGDVRLLVDRHCVGVHMGDVAAGEQERDARDLQRLLHGARDLLSNRHDGGEKISRRIVEIREMLPRQDLGVAGADRAPVQKGEQALVLVHDMGRDLPLTDAAKQTVAAHGIGSPALSLAFPQLRSEAQSRRSSRKQSTGADDRRERMRMSATPVHWKPHFSSTRREAGLLTRARPTSRSQLIRANAWSMSARAASVA